MHRDCVGSDAITCSHNTACDVCTVRKAQLSISPVVFTRVKPLRHLSQWRSNDKPNRASGGISRFRFSRMNRKNECHFDIALRSRLALIIMIEGVGALRFPGQAPGISKSDRSRMLGASPPCSCQSDGVQHLPCCRAEIMMRSVSRWAYEMRIEQATSRQ